MVIDFKQTNTKEIGSLGTTSVFNWETTVSVWPSGQLFCFGFCSRSGQFNWVRGMYKVWLGRNRIIVRVWSRCCGVSSCSLCHYWSGEDLLQCRQQCEEDVFRVLTSIQGF
jgi:hypothetical protein